MFAVPLMLLLLLDGIGTTILLILLVVVLPWRFSVISVTGRERRTNE